MRDRTVIIGAPTLEQRMIGWRIGWRRSGRARERRLTCPHLQRPCGEQVRPDRSRAALEAPDDGLAAANAEWQRRRDETLRQLHGLPAVRPRGTWSLFLDVTALGLDCVELSDRLLEHQVAATPMRGWGGAVADRHLRFVFSNEPVERLAVLGERLRATLAKAGVRT
jgi:N-succinyldiaminopimelate aminotransferase